MSISPSITKSITRNVSPSLDGVAKAVFPGASGDFISTPDSVAASITGDIDIRGDLEPDDWSAAANQGIISKWSSAGPDRAYLFYIDTSGFLHFGWEQADDTAFDKISTLAVSFLNGIRGQPRATLDVDNGGGDAEVKFYTRNNASEAWVQLGTTVLVGATTNIRDSTDDINVGAITGSTTSQLIGLIYSAQIFNGIEGALAVDFNADDYIAGKTLTSQETGEVYTLNGNVTISRA